MSGNMQSSSDDVEKLHLSEQEVRMYAYVHYLCGSRILPSYNVKYTDMAMA